MFGRIEPQNDDFLPQEQEEKEVIEGEITIKDKDTIRDWLIKKYQNSSFADLQDVALRITVFAMEKKTLKFSDVRKICSVDTAIN
jgi:hypothetical protein